jgi:hypothetical protein
MKKFILMLLILSALTLCIACEKDDTKGDDTANDNQQSDGTQGSVILPEDIFE